MAADETKKKPLEIPITSFNSLDQDTVHNIFSRLPAKSLASAACVCQSWSHHSDRILSRPKLASALSANPSLDVALQEVFDKVFSEPIRPHFAIANGFGYRCGLRKTYNFLASKLGFRTPFVVTWTAGIMGRDAVTNVFKEVVVVTDDANFSDDEEEPVNTNCGILLTVGFLPGLKVEAIPLFRPLKKPLEDSMVDTLVMDIRDYTASVSACNSPVGIIMFGGQGRDLKLAMEKLDYAMSKETVIAGDESTEFLYRSGMETRNISQSTKFVADAIALVFARDINKPDGIGEIQFHGVLSSGVSSVGPRYKAVSVKANNHGCTTWLTARQDGQIEILDGERILSHINDLLYNRIGGTDLYIGVTKQRKCVIGTEKSKIMRSLAFHGIMGADEEYLFVYGTGIRTADLFQFYHSDTAVALSSCRKVSKKLRNLKQDWCSKKSRQPSDNAKECIGGFVFSCCGRGESFFGLPNVDSSPFLENFPGVPLAGISCGGEIGRGFITNAQEESSPNCNLHVFSTVYLIMTYSEAPVQV